MNAYSIPGFQRIPIEAIAASIWDINVASLSESTRKREVVEARQVLMKYRKEVLKESFRISASHYNRDHATALHGVKTANNLLETDSNFRVKYELFLERASKSAFKKLKK